MRAFHVFALLLFSLSTSAALGARARTNVENESLCERFGEGLKRKFAVNPQLLVKDLDELIVKVGSLGPDRINHDRSGRKLASIAGPSNSAAERTRPQTRNAALDVRVHIKLTEANRVLTQTKRKGFFDEDEERAAGVQEACAKVIFDRATTLEKMTRSE